MAQLPRDYEKIDLAKERLRSSNSAREIRVCLAVILPTEHGMSIKDTAIMLGRSTRWVSYVRKSFIEHGLSTVSENLGGRRRANMSIAEEEAFLDSFRDRVKSGDILKVSEIHARLEKVLSRKVHLSVVYKLLYRHGWHKLAPRKRNAKNGFLLQEA